MTSVSVGIGLAFVAMLCWGFGDFLIQKSTRKIGDWETLFFMTAFGALVLLPFVWKSLPTAFENQAFTILLLTSLILFIAALIDFEALKEGKLAVVEPIWSFEVPMAAFLAFIIIGERISGLQMFLVLALIIFLMLVAFREKKITKKLFMEKGVYLAFLGAMLMGSANFFMGWSGRVTDPLMVNFFTDAFIMILTGLYLVSKGRFLSLGRDLKNGYQVLLPMSIFDKVAWIAFVFSMTLAPIAIATALSESYIIIAVLMGLFVNREKILTHQKVGLVGAVVTVIVLSVITAG
ncbi:MAG: DMT family transporter [Candidatus Paceibacterota bacterium]|jgi:drug/metabolite transporter (DMT)-like permease